MTSGGSSGREQIDVRPSVVACGEGSTFTTKGLLHDFTMYICVVVLLWETFASSRVFATGSRGRDDYYLVCFCLVRVSLSGLNFSNEQS